MGFPVPRPEGDPGALEDAAAMLCAATGFVGGARSSFGAGRDLALTCWSSPVADDFRESSERWDGHLRGAVDGLAGVEAVLTALATSLRDAQAEHDRLRRRWEESLASGPRSVSAADGPAAVDEAFVALGERFRLEEQAQGVLDDYDVQLRAASSALLLRTEALAPGSGCLSPEDVWAMVVGRHDGLTRPPDLEAFRAADSLAGGEFTGLRPPEGADPHAVGDWWRALSGVEPRWLLLDAPELIGNLDGVPFSVRDEANRARIADERVRLLQEQEVLIGKLEGTWKLVNLTNDDARLRHVTNRLRALDSIEQVLRRTDPPRQLLLLDTTHEQTLAAIGIGDVDTARHVSVFTPGMGTTVHDNLQGMDYAQNELRKLAQQQLLTSGSDDQVATVAWLGYEAPMGKDTWKPSRSVAGKALGERGAPSLASFLNGIDAARVDDPHLTALGHSYGSFTTGLALQRPTGVDDAVFYGSPGVGTSDADDLLVPAGHRFVIEADRDPVADFARFGIDPNQMEGMTVLSADEARRPDGSVLNGSKGHSAYTAADSTSQYNLSRVVAGLESDRVYSSGYGLGDLLQTPPPGFLR